MGVRSTGGPPPPFTPCGRLDTAAVLGMLDRDELCDPERRALLLSGIPGGVRRRLRGLARPFDQLLADYRALQGVVLEDGSRPLARLLSNAALILGGYPEAGWFGALSRVIARGELAGGPRRPALVWIPEGRIELGPPAGACTDQSRSLALAAPLLMTATPITIAHYRATVGASPIDAAADEPVVSVDLASARRYCDALSLAEGFRPVYGRGSAHPADAQADGYRLPTSAHWEFACRGGTTTAWWFGDAADRLGDVAWFVANSELRPHPVGRKARNPWGLYDVHGNVWEWTAAKVGGRAEIRGGSCRERPRALRSDARALRPPHERRRTIGFRVVRPA